MGMCLWSFIRSANIYWLLYAGPGDAEEKRCKVRLISCQQNLLGVSSSGHKKKQETAQASLSSPGRKRYPELSVDDFYWLLIIPDHFYLWKTNFYNYQCIYSGGSFIVAEDGCASHVCWSWQICQGCLHQGLWWVFHGVACQSAHRLDWHVWDFAHHSLRDPGQSALRTFTSGRKDELGEQFGLCTQLGQAPELLQTSGHSRSLSQACGAALWVPLQWRAISKFSPSLGTCPRHHEPFLHTPLAAQVGATWGLRLFCLRLCHGNWALHIGRQQWGQAQSVFMAFWNSVREAE